MSVMRVEKNSNYTVMANYHLRDKGISLKAKGLLSVMLSLPAEWDYTLAGLAHISKEGVDAIGTAVKELEYAGYVVRTRRRNEAGQLLDTDYTIYEFPQNKKTEEANANEHKPAPVTPIPEKPILENPVLDNPVQAIPSQEKPIREKAVQLNTEEKKKKILIYQILINQISIHQSLKRSVLHRSTKRPSFLANKMKHWSVFSIIRHDHAG